ncbi:MAG: ComF family protein [Coriobacteriia bacterium]|nr:ComF family protein [Coriobacteriia bacterium]
MGWNILKEVLLELVAPTRCAGCERPGSVLCDRCIDEIRLYRKMHPCVRCGAPYGELICTECEGEEFTFDRVVCLGELDGPLSRAVVIYKDGFELRLGKVLGDLLAQRCAFQFMAEGDRIDLVTWIPPSTHALRQRGYDHAMILAQSVARRLGVECTQYLVCQKRKDLRTLSREQRREAMSNSFKIIDSDIDVNGRHLLIVDDVLTTGATMQGAASIYRQHGAASVTGAVLARAW